MVCPPGVGGAIGGAAVGIEVGVGGFAAGVGAFIWFVVICFMF
jgi:hypothetical protein